MKSLFIEYPRLDMHRDIFAELCNLHLVDMKIALPIVSADTKGIEVKFPSFLSGIFYVKIQDGDHSFLKRIAIQ